MVDKPVARAKTKFESIAPLKRGELIERKGCAKVVTPKRLWQEFCGSPQNSQCRQARLNGIDWQVVGAKSTCKNN